MYSSTQAKHLDDLIEAVDDSASTDGCSEDLTVVSSAALWALVQESRRLKALNQRLLIGHHEHKHGESIYLFLVPQDVEFDTEEFEANLQEEFEPQDGERLSVEAMDEPTVIDGAR